MPSENQVARALQALAGPRDTFHSAVATAVDQVRAYLEARRAPANGHDQRIAVELGRFAQGRLDVDAFAAIFGDREAPDPLALARIEKAYEILRGTLEAGDALFTAEVPSGGDLRDTVRDALARAGRVFAAARAVEAARAGRYQPEDHDRFLKSFPFELWNRPERRIAPPLVVEVDGGDLHAAALAEFMDGSQKIVLLVRGQAPPAPLVRLITPDVLVVQTESAEDLEVFGMAASAGVAALLPVGCARFVHHPASGSTLRQRLTVDLLPEEEPRKVVGTISVFQQTEELRQLVTLARSGEAAAGEVGATTETGELTDPVDKLAAWLLRQAEATGLS